MDLTTSDPSRFIFPVLRTAEILQCLSEIGIELTKPEITEPHRHKDRVRKVFLGLLGVCCGLSEEDFTLEHALPSNSDNLTHPELHEESFSDLKFFKEVRAFMETCGFHGFGLRDLHAPDFKRFRFQLSGAINMAKFREDQLKLYVDLSQPRSEMLLGLAEVIEEKNQLTEHLDATEIASSSKSKEIMEIEDDCATLGMEIARNNKLQATKREEATVLKKKANDLKDDIATASLALEEALAEEKNLSGKVVSSPERRKEDLNHKRELLDRERTECAVIEEKLDLAKNKIVNVTQAEQDCRMAITVAEEVHDRTQEHSQVMEQVYSAAEKVETNETEKAKLLVQKDECERTFHRTEEKIAHFRKQSKMKMDAAQEAFESAQLQLIAVEKDQRDGKARVEAGEAEVRALEANIEEETRRANKEIAKLIAEYRETEKAIMEQETKFMATLQT